eukprot:scaffold145239_cov45-Attheya_sp.AAC.5
MTQRMARLLVPVLTHSFLLSYKERLTTDSSSRVESTQIPGTQWYRQHGVVYLSCILRYTRLPCTMYVT